MCASAVILGRVLRNHTSLWRVVLNSSKVDVLPIAVTVFA